jgi:hypothetical protein
MNETGVTANLQWLVILDRQAVKEAHKSLLLPVT